MKVEQWKIDKIGPYQNNPRENEGAIEDTAMSIEQYGWRQPIVVDKDGVIIAGDTRYRAALRLGLSEVPVHVARDLSEAQIKAYRLADNKTGEKATWEPDLLSLEFESLENEYNFDLDLTGFDKHEIDEIKQISDNELGSKSGEIQSEGLGKSKTKVKVVLSPDVLSTFENAVLATGQNNRADAVKEICEAYIGKEGQLNDTFQDLT